MPHRYRRIAILTGAGLSAESGLATFRDRDGIWSKVDYREVATPEGFRADPRKVLAFYDMRRRGVREVAPNAAHLALARFEKEHTARHDGRVTIITQNIDNLHERAGTSNLIHMHGELMNALCSRCETRHPWPDDLDITDACPACRKAGVLRPDVVWFGEVPYHMERIEDVLRGADLFVAIGTSGTVYPAAGFVAHARACGARAVELNLEPSQGVSLFHEAIHGKATDIVPAFVERVLENAV